MVRLKVGGNGETRQDTNNFNSTMVRLKESAEEAAKAAMEFQFHYGTIKRARKELEYNGT